MGQCKPCVNTKSRARKTGIPEGHPMHGTMTGYQQRGCRCDLCVAAAGPYWRRYKYNFNDELEKAYMAATNCQICMVEFVVGTGKRADRNGKEKVVDHCHITGKVRGFICANCNSALGLMDDDVARLASAADYLLNAKEGHEVG